ncbi:hypothetical protein [Janthinobacterium sp. BJB446]|uniref:hypothetical protein n=1 Tax=Janthinobacterium sp. BJB446 TaxID=2048009 RepID=UPI001179A777|nr:hypothetical protein [Janthinobacterium sp. BJB446]
MTSPDFADNSLEISVSVPVNTSITEDGFVLKNVDKIECIRTRMDSRMTVSLYSWQASREIRRDFNLLSCKIFTRGQDKRFLAQVRELLLEMVTEGEFLKADALPFFDGALPEPMHFPLRIVCPEAGLLLRAFQDADKPIAYLNLAASSGKLDRIAANDMAFPFLAAYRNLKMFLLGINTSKETAQALGEQAGIS